MILAIIQARMSSTRLPGKVLLEVDEKPLLAILISRLSNSKYINKVIVATSDHDSDDIIEEFCKENNVNCFRGDLNDVLSRYYQCAKLLSPKHVIRITADCPLIDCEIVDQVVKMHLDSNADYTSNTIEPTFPDGLDTEVIRMEVLEYINTVARLPSQREHVTKYIIDNKAQFKICSYKDNLDHSDLRWTVDTIDDFQVIKTICCQFDHIEQIKYNQILNLYTQPDIYDQLSVNLKNKRNEGLKKSLEEDKIYMEKLNE